MPEDLEPPEARAGDRVHELVAGTISAVPWAGGPGAAIFEWIVPSSLERRRQSWREAVAAKLRELEEQGVNLEYLENDEGFVTLVLEASKAALSTHIEEKLEMLASCLHRRTESRP